MIACPFVCAGCSPSAKIFTWGDKGHRWQRGKGRNGYAFVCKNPDVDLASVSDGNIVALAKSEALQPYMLDGIVAWALESVVAIIVLTPLVAAALRLRQRRP